jgi:hypothetical protein
MRRLLGRDQSFFIVGSEHTFPVFYTAVFHSVVLGVLTCNGTANVKGKACKCLFRAYAEQKRRKGCR